MKIDIKAGLLRFRQHGLHGLLSVALVLLGITGCDSCLRRQPPASAPVVQTPLTPRPAPQPQTPVSPVSAPVQTPSAPPPRPPDAPDPEPVEGEEPPRPEQYDASMLSLISPGMTYDEVREVLGNPGVVIAGTDQRNLVYRWSYTGQSFMGRFEDGRLIRKNLYNPGTSEEELDEAVLQFDRELIDRIQPGMLFDEVMEIIGMNAQPLTGEDAAVQLYKWTDKHGSSITARFEDQVLKRSSGMIVAPEEREADEAEQDEVYPDDAPREEEFFQEEDMEPAAERYAEEMPPAWDDPPPPPPAVEPPSEPAPQPSRIRVVGAERREREIAENPSPHAGRSYQPQVRLPEVGRSLRPGAYEVRILNTTSSRARVALTSDAGGMEFSVPANGSTSRRLPRGTYQVHFIYDDDPYTLHRGQRIPVEEMLTDFVVYLFDDSSQLDLL